MEQFNWNHLKYFYHVAREGSITKAAERLYVTPQTISSQLALLEDSLGYSLFDRHGKRLKLNQEGQLVLRYAEDIFKTGRELLAELKNAELSTRRVVSIGILDSIPKILSCQILDRVYSTSENIRIVTHETDFEQLLADLALNKLDMILSDRPVPPNVAVKAYSKLLTTSNFTFFATPKRARKLRASFPESLNHQHFLMPGERSVQYTHVLSWFSRLDLTPIILGEFDDTELMKMLGQQGRGIFCAPTIIAKYIQLQYGVKSIGTTDKIQESYYSITPERKIKNPVIELIHDMYKDG
ncbi:transcriptional activator NhaR [Saccharophagus degradans]|uniref:Transcriptional regulator, LysR family n=2 Tax=Saccharophagus degradans TaxID=86304 RepID=Q21FK9_SACD2|nr:transcriptional activator NhaR [Saccharophagus degradans]ABD82520.1 transcriptional regulator, LysR family [Saccharophagus degradans 2-40]MBU2985290.1 transcriptional activator NhaR [Saccharophagus degradans]MDO6421371.1 transcriptional activator NhaR [Saccharophagus degradans]MDO6609568.1 transcriptional activator NhaR [Saccharophagus degradans]WGO99291.1 transcriptional activator NhaR [Saccharophagus degradans]